MEKITLSKDKLVYGQEVFGVFTGGDYESTDLVDVYNVSDTTKIVCSFQANYVAYGNVYNDNVTNVIHSTLLIHKYLKSNIQLSVEEINYDILGLHKKRRIIKGELVNVEYYGKYDPVTKQYSDLILSEDRIYYRENQMVSRREMIIKWFDENGSVVTTKKTIKYYSTIESIQELDSRRSNIISELKINTIGLISICSGVTSVEAQAIGRPFLNTYALDVSKYLQGYERELREAIINDTIYSWLNAIIPNTNGITIRMYLLNGLDVDYELNNINT
jgi:hypothetical protein